LFDRQAARIINTINGFTEEVEHRKRAKTCIHYDAWSEKQKTQKDG